LLLRVARDTAPVQVSIRTVVGEPRPWAQVRDLPARPCPVGTRWGAAWDSAWFEIHSLVPAHWALGDTVLVLALGCETSAGFGAEGLGFGAEGLGFGAEGLAFDGETGRALGGVSAMHPYIAAPSRDLCVVVEAAANPSAWGRTPPEPDPGGAPLYQLQAAHLALLDRRVLDELYDLRLAAELATVPTRPRQPVARVFAVGNAHLDTAWLWPYRETRRKIARTLATALALIETDPDYRFAVSQPQQLDWLAEDDPRLFARVRDAVLAGRIEPVGAMWVESDCNLPSGESLARQILAGQRWWRERFGVAAAEVWLPDCFGFPPGLPGLMRHARLRRFVTQKLSWNDTNRLPHHSFWWQGLDGSRVLAHFPPADTYVGEMSVADLVRLEHNLQAAGDPPPALYLYGFGDGGGGPTPTMLRMADRLAERTDLPAPRLATVGEFFAALEAESADLPVWVGELYLEYHRGTYTTHGWLKSALRRAESALRAAELLTAAAGRGDPLDGLWRQLLLQQFHDVAPGTSIRRVNREAIGAVLNVCAQADEAADAALGVLAARIDTCGHTDPWLVFDPAEGGRTDLAVVDRSVAGGQRLADGSYALLVSTPAQGWKTIDLARPPAGAKTVTAAGNRLENEALRATFSADGDLESVWDKAASRELLAATVDLQLLVDTPRNWDAWDIDREAFASAEPVRTAATVQLVETGPLRAAIRVTRQVGERSAATCTWSITAGQRRLDLALDLNWQEDHRLLKLAVPIAVQTTTATCEVAWGQANRPLHRNTSWEQARFEICAHRWVDVAEPGFGVALLNDGRYGHDVSMRPDGSGSLLRLSLLRAPTWPDPTVDRGSHRIRVALRPHGADLTGVRADAAALNSVRHCRALPVQPGDLPACGQLVRARPDSVHVTAVKPADGAAAAVAVRVFETAGDRAAVELDGHLIRGSWCRADLLETPLTQWQPVPVSFPLAPFEIATILIRRLPAPSVVDS
ncbi:MAG: alpha-mannosidase, partial [Mycobacteriales bacterium]